MSEPFIRLTAIAAPLALDNVDTDLIWPAGGNQTLLRGAQAVNLFATLRYNADGSARPDFILNQAPWQRAKLLIAGRNFGCGSSREMAVWALSEWGLRCVIAPSFGDIFFSNACLNGLLPVALPEPLVGQLLATVADPKRCWLTVDLVEKRVQGHDFDAHFEIATHRRECLLAGLDNLGYTLSLSERIAAYAAQYSSEYAWTTLQSAWFDEAMSKSS